MSEVTRVTTLSRGGSRAGRPVEACLVELSGPSIGKRHALGTGSWIIGRDPHDGSDGPSAPGEGTIILDVDSVSRRHARIVEREGTYLVEDLGSTNGTMINQQQVHGEALLRTGDLLQVGRVWLKFISGDDVESKYHEAIYQLAITDGLTQIHNKRYLLEFLEREMGRCHRYERALSLILFDIDHFKRINDTRGHLAGDHVLRELASLIRGRVRKEQCFARYGGEEFAIALPEVGPENARHLAEKIRQSVAEHVFSFDGQRIPVTVSVGVADMTIDLTEPQQFIRVADTQLYAAKSGGRNRIAG
jgi:two-component system, cell cycle response regulator